MPPTLRLSKYLMIVVSSVSLIAPVSAATKTPPPPPLKITTTPTPTVIAPTANQTTTTSTTNTNGTSQSSVMDSIIDPRLSMDQDITTPPTKIPRDAVKVPILIYHSVRPYYDSITPLVRRFTVPPDVFDNQMKYLIVNGYTPILPGTLASYFAHHAPLPPKPVIVTFDDGWENQYRYAFPILKKYKIPGVFYIYSDAIGHKHFFTWQEVQDLKSAGMVIGGHSKSHPQMPKITNQSTLDQEAGDSKRIIEGKIGIPVTDFAYPFGEYNDQAVAAIKRANYTTGRGVTGGSYQTAADLYTLHGIIVDGDFNKFVALLAK